MLLPVVKALLGHYRRYPLQIFLVWLGLTLSVSLLVGVTAINHHARQSYQDSETLFANPFPYQIRTKQLVNRIPQGFYVQLRREGFQQCVPFDSHRVMTQNGTDFTLLGVDAVAMLALQETWSADNMAILALTRPPYPLMVSQDFARLQGWKNGDMVTLNDQTQLGPLWIDNQALIQGARVVADLSLIRQLKPQTGLSAIACGALSETQLQTLKNHLPKGLVLVQSQKFDLLELTKGFHSNLTAMGMLSFVVGLFIYYQAMSLSLIQRQPLVGILRQIGVSGWQLTQAITVELSLFILLSWLCGNLFGLLLANQLIPSVSMSLANLYDANVGLTVHWNWRWGLLSLLMALCGALFSCAWPLVRLLRTQPIRLTTRLSLVRFAGKEFTLQAIVASVLLIIGVVLYRYTQTSLTGFIIIVCMLLSVALLTPFLIWKVFISFSYTLRWVKVRWFFADAAASMSYRGVATMAFMLALAANIGVETTIGSFRATTEQWLTQRLAADMYLFPTQSSASRMSQWLDRQPEVDQVWWRWENELLTEKGIIQVVSSGNTEQEQNALTVKLAVPDYWYHLHHSRSLMISESMATKLGIRPGDYLDLPSPLGNQWLVAGVYYDYGNPYHQILLSHSDWLSAFGGVGNVSLAVVLHSKNDVEPLRKRLEQLFRLGTERVFDSTQLHNRAMQVFDRTFLIANTLGKITLFIAICGIFFATFAGEVSRQRHIALLRCLGVSAIELIVIGALQLFVFGAIALLVALPLGVVLAQLVMDVVMRFAFGWTMELVLLPMAYWQTTILAMSALILAGALPVVRLVRRSAMKSLRDAL